MPDKSDRKKAMKDYKERKETGGVYRIVNTVTGWKSPLQATVNLEGSRNRFEFGKNTNICFDKAVAELWKEYGAESFVFVEVERLDKKLETSAADFREEVEALRELWAEKG